MFTRQKANVLEFALVAMFVCSTPTYAATVDVTPRPIASIAPGTRIVGTETPPGYSRLVLVSFPRITKENAEKLPDFVEDLAKFITGTMAAKVISEDVDGQKKQRLEKVAFGLGTMINGHHTIITSDTQKKLGANFGFIRRTIFEENEKAVRERMLQVARTPTMSIIDSTLYVLYKGKHRLMVVRHCVILLDGKLGALVWLLDSQDDKSYRLAEPQMQFLGTRFREDRVFSFDESKIILGMVPKEDAFALAQIPQGKPIPFPKSLKELAAARRFTVETATALEEEMRKLWGK